MTIAFERTPDDLIHFTHFHAQHSGAVQRSRRQQTWTFIVSLTVMMSYALWDKGLVVIAGGVLSGTLLWVLLGKKLTKRQMSRVIGRMLTEGHQKGLMGRHEIELTSAGIVERGPLHETRTAWPAIERIVEDERSIYIYCNPATAHVIPKAEFETPQLAIRFVSEAHELWDASKVALAS